jgi:formate transporter
MGAESAATVDDAKPPEAAKNVLEYLTGKIAMPTGKTAVLSVLAGAYIAFGAIVFLVTGAGGDGFSGPQTLLSGLGFSVGLMLVIVAGAELFTGDTLLVVKRVRGSLSAGTMWRFWGLVYAGNFVGALLVAALFILAGGHMAGEGAVGANILEVAGSKADKGVLALFASGILANMLVCLAVWAAQAARTIPGKILALTGPVAAFVTAGLEHSVANMSILPMGLMIDAFAAPEFWQMAGTEAGAEPGLTLGGALVNIAVCTVGNAVGGASIGLAYWYAYLRE